MDSPEIAPYRVRRAPFAPPESAQPPRFFLDRALLILFAVALALNLALAIFLFWRFDSLPDVLPLHFDASGFPDRIDSKAGIFAMPIIAFIVLVLNTALAGLAHHAERAASVLLAFSALLVEALMWLGALNIVGGFFPA